MRGRGCALVRPRGPPTCRWDARAARSRTHRRYLCKSLLPTSAETPGHVGLLANPASHEYGHCSCARPAQTGQGDKRRLSPSHPTRQANVAGLRLDVGTFFLQYSPTHGALRRRASLGLRSILMRGTGQPASLLSPGTRRLCELQSRCRVTEGHQETGIYKHTKHSWVGRNTRMFSSTPTSQHRSPVSQAAGPAVSELQ